MKLKAMGVVPGVPDFVCVVPLFAVELKMGTTPVSPAQSALHPLWIGRGVKLHLVRTNQQFHDAMMREAGSLYAPV